MSSFESDDKVVWVENVEQGGNRGLELEGSYRSGLEITNQNEVQQMPEIAPANYESNMTDIKHQVETDWIEFLFLLKLPNVDAVVVYDLTGQDVTDIRLGNADWKLPEGGFKLINWNASTLARLELAELLS